MLTKADILSKVDLKREVVQVPEWGGAVTISELSGEARDRWELSVLSQNGKRNLQNLRAKLVAASIINPDGSLMFSETDVEKLGRKSSKALDRIFEAAQKLNAISDNEVDELAKN